MPKSVNYARACTSGGPVGDCYSAGGVELPGGSGAAITGGGSGVRAAVVFLGGARGRARGGSSGPFSSSR